jgi:hypothetical protein
MFDRTRIIKFVPGQVVNGFRVVTYAEPDNKGLPIYIVRCTACQTEARMHHRRPSALQCIHCQLQATRASLSQSESQTAKLAAIRRYDEQVERDAEYAKRNPAAPAPAPPKPLRRLTQIEKWELDGSLKYGSKLYNATLEKITKRIREEG